MALCHMTLVDRQRIARDTMAFWFDTNGASFEFRADSTLILSLRVRSQGPTVVVP